MAHETDLSASTAVAAVPERRSCTRCAGQQILMGESGGMGKYRCDHCELVVGFDLESDPVEFLLSRGQPGSYSKDIFGSQLLSTERRLP